MDAFPRKITDKDFIGKLIPQKAPFVMVDKLLHFETNKVVSGLTVVANNIFVQHDRFTAPGLIEHMAQTVALYTGYQYFLKQQDAPIGYIGAIKKAEILALPKVGDQLVTTVNVLHEIMDVTLVTASTVCGENVMARSEMKTVLAS